MQRRPRAWENIADAASRFFGIAVGASAGGREGEEIAGCVGEVRQNSPSAKRGEFFQNNLFGA